MSEPKDMILPMLREIRDEMKASFVAVDKRFERLEQRFDNLREAVNGESVLGRYAAAEVEDRLEKIERRPADLEGRH
jgi:hypothetical protein